MLPGPPFIHWNVCDYCPCWSLVSTNPQITSYPNVQWCWSKKQCLVSNLVILGTDNYRVTLVVLTLFPVLQLHPLRSGSTLHSSPSMQGCIWHHHFCATMDASTQDGAALVVPATCPGKQEHLTVWDLSSILFLLQHRCAAITSQVPAFTWTMWLLCEDALVSCPQRDTIQTVSSSALPYMFCRSLSCILSLFSQLIPRNVPFIYSPLPITKNRNLFFRQMAFPCRFKTPWTTHNLKHWSNVKLSRRTIPEWN